MSDLAPLRQRKKRIRDRWVREVLATYPDDRGRFLERERDRFANPVGASIEAAADALVEVLLGEASSSEAREALDTLVRIRSVQEFTVQQALVPVFLLKKIIRDELGDQLGAVGLDGWRVVEERVDGMALDAFEIFVSCRQSMYEIRAKASEKRNAVLLRRAAKALGLEEAPEAWDGSGESQE